MCRFMVEYLLLKMWAKVEKNQQFRNEYICAKLNIMKFAYILFLLICLAACQNQDSKGNTSGDGTANEQTIPTSQKPPVAPSSESPEQLRNLARNILRMELPNTFAEQRGDRQAVKSYSFKVQKNNGRPTWIIKEKLHDSATNKLYTGSDYMLLWEVVDANSIQIVNTQDGKWTGISIRPTPGNTFVYHPYTQEPDVAVTEVVIGWYDHSQDQTLLRLYTNLKQLADKMGEWDFEK